MNFFKFLLIIFIVTILFVSVESQDCSFDYASYKGSQERFNIILKDKKAADSHFQWLRDCSNKSIKRISTADSVKNFEENTARDFSVEDAQFYGYTAYFDPEFVENHLKNNSDIKIAERDAKVSIQNQRDNRHCRRRTITRKNPTPNLDRIDQKKFPLNGKYIFPATAGKGVTIYIVDTGIFVKHNEFKGRAVHGGSFCIDCIDTDDNGHGTHVAGIAAGKTFGVANKAKLIAVKVFDASGSGLFSDVIAGLSFVLSDHNANRRKNSVVNMSLIGGKNEAANAAVRALTDNNIHVAVAAGNTFESDACDFSPASAETAITVGATTDTSDELAFFTNIGKCVDIFAPGENVKSAFIGSKDSTAILTGTSMSTPHVAGTVALIIAEYGNSSPSKMANSLNKFATKDIIPDPKGSPNVFLRVPPARKRCNRYY